MTLILSTVNMHAACTSTDTQYTLEDGTPAHRAVKSVVIICKDSKFLLSYTGNNVVFEHRGEKITLADWIAEILAEINLNELNIDGVVEFLITSLEEKYYAPIVYPLVIVLVGWLTDEINQFPMIYTISNCYDENLSPIPTIRGFNMTSEVVDDNSPKLYVHGSVQRNSSKEIEDQVLKVEELTASNADFNKFEKEISVELQELNDIARATPKDGKFIGEEVVTTILNPDENSSVTIPYPDTCSYFVSNLVSPLFSIKGMSVVNDPLKGGRIITTVEDADINAQSE